jgi:hypothetical protein
MPTMQSFEEVLGLLPKGHVFDCESRGRENLSLRGTRIEVAA